MKKIQIETNISYPIKAVNHDAVSLLVTDKQGVITAADGAGNKGYLSGKWAQFLCDRSPLTAITSLQCLKYFIEDVWEDFYDTNNQKIGDPFHRNIFEKQGSFSTYTACWFENKNDKTYYQWLSYGNSAVLVYDTKKDELFVPDYKDSLVGFLKNKGLVNWKEDDLEEEYLLTGSKKELTNNLKVILATDAMAEHLILSYLILKAKDDDYWEKLQELMHSDAKLSELIYQNRNSFSYQSFDDVLKKWEEEEKNNSLDTYIRQLQNKGQIAKDDITLQVISAVPKGGELILPAKQKKQVLKPKAPKIKIPVKVPFKPKPKQEFKFSKEKYMDVLLDHNITKLYHFTDRSNIAMINRMRGLYSWEYMESKNNTIPTPGGDNLSRMLDARYGLGNYVRTSFCQNHPMMHVARNQGRIPDPVILHIDPVIVTLYDTLFSDMNATKNEHQKGEKLDDLERVKFDICLQRNHFNVEPYEKPYYQAEVMVKQFIPVKYIMNLNQFL